MKIAILSDIHGNGHAYMAVEKELHRQDINHVLFAGDQLGYYYDAQKIYESLKNWSHHIIAGNHERMFAHYLDSERDSDIKRQITEKYGGAFEYYEKTFPDDLKRYVRKLPDKVKIEIDGIRFLLCHGTAEDKDYYLYPTAAEKILQNNQIEDVDYIFMGHTHYPMIYSGTKSVLINVGSVGQSRVVGGIANWGVFSTENKVYSPQSTPYRIKDVEKRLQKFGEKKRVPVSNSKTQ